MKQDYPFRDFEKIGVRLFSVGAALTERVSLPLAVSAIDLAATKKTK